ncbi:MAG: hypothetical protein ACRDJW_23645 [Thermomicrobiales bacterium]
MIRLVMVTMACFGLSFYAGFSVFLVPADAQDNTEGRLGTLETQVADQGTEVAGLRKRVKRLEGAVLTPQAEQDAQASAENPPESTDAELQPTNTPRPVASGPVGTRDNPVPIGTAADVGGGWQLSVLDVVPNGTDLVMAENQFNDPPAEGRQFFLVTVTATYYGDESAAFTSSVGLSAVGASNVAYESFEARCGVIPNELSRAEVFPGGAIEGNVCWSVMSDDAGSLVMFSDSFFSFDDDDRVYFSLQRE